ncbi:penicillin-binding protein 2 [Chitinophaga polysaccharea]|uniref:Penicillin-binding protein 2 n=1 Tax=Chitinophaga polysaccharea TaxID=1293035 RepID=A0A561PT71_9BACT|nr:penicillin-binding protein 2 [Chitinophaga polysaccharea]TWF41311.1 penicillin-binding protein 2 [Chitinophaga polysaccharea]
MSVYHQPRKRVIILIITALVLIITARLLFLQVIEKKYVRLADANAVVRKIVYPSRGIIFDRQNRSILSNDILYDLVVTPAAVKKIDTAYLCNILQIDKAEFRSRIADAVKKNGRVRPSVFAGLLSATTYSRLQESMYLFQSGFELVPRPIRSYPYKAAANILGYIGEISPAMLKMSAYEDYQSGDYIGLTGLEKTYEAVLMGQRGTQYILKDNLNRPQGALENGEFDTAAIAGKNLRLSLDIELQVLGERLMRNKVGSIVAIDPQTGGILAMVSGPVFDPNLLTGSSRTRNVGKLFSDPTEPFLNRGIQATYQPGSAMKPLTALVALDEGLITPGFGYPCHGAYTSCGHVVKCLHSEAGHAANLRVAMAHSCNAYFIHLYRMEVDADKWGGVKKGHTRWREYMTRFGLGHKLGVDIPGENGGIVADTTVLNRLYRGQWNSCSELYVGMGQGQVAVTPLQMANVMCMIANRGYYYLPHLVQSIDNDHSDLLMKYKEKHAIGNVSDTAYRSVIYGMEDVIEHGTGRGAQIAGIAVCGKTGTAQNRGRINGKVVDLEDHSVFVAFAPRDNPRIAIAVIVENAGTGARFAVPIANLMMEKYLKDTLPASKIAIMQRMLESSTIPAEKQGNSKIDSLNTTTGALTAADILKQYFH